MKSILKTAVAVAIVLSAGAALAGPSASDKCEASKNKAAGAYYACREKAEAAAISKGGDPVYTKCITKFTDKWGAAESTGNTDCLDNLPLSADAEAYLADQATHAAGLIAGGTIPTPPECGDGAVNASGEHCDGSALDSYTCASFGLYGTLACTAGCDFDTSGCTACPAPGIQYGSACWFLGALAANCAGTCAAHGMVYDDATSIVAGSQGSDVNCVALLDAAGASGGALDNAGGDCAGLGLGCAVLPETGFRARCGTPATDSSSLFADAQRVCACR